MNPFILLIDTMTTVSVIKRLTLERLRSGSKSGIVLEPLDLNLCGIKGSRFLTYGKVCLRFSLSQTETR